MLGKLGTAYQAYVAFCKNDVKKDPEKKTDIRKVPKDLGYKIDNSKVDGNQLYILNARVVVDARAALESIRVSCIGSVHDSEMNIVNVKTLFY